uniref:Transmembrane protein n=1 Tax=Parascaris equorum TaxID=6256 RepID=A0A914R2X3_PAREQ
MDIVVYLALFVLGAVFLFSLFILIVMCKRRALASPQYFRSSALRFSKLRNWFYRLFDFCLCAAIHLCEKLVMARASLCTGKGGTQEWYNRLGEGRKRIREGDVATYFHYILLERRATAFSFAPINFHFPSH